MVKTSGGHEKPCRMGALDVLVEVKIFLAEEQCSK
ncbi:hypothetical protein C4K25_3745 [Pseudomonas chlororaphis]|nr:hypothetical protein C4K25_3745 [Pseudomonas chlororaphis]